MKVPLVLLVVAYFTCAANAIILSQEQQNLFKNRCQSLAVHLNDATMRCARALDALLNVENRKSCDFTPVFDALGFVVPGYVGNAHYPLFWSALDGAAGFVDDKGKAINPYTNILRQNANFLTIWSSFNILPGALFNMENFNIIPRFLVDRFCQQYSEWMARNTEANTPSLWMTGGTDNGYFPRPLNGRLPGVFQQYEVPNIESDHVIVFHVPKQIVTGKQCGSDQESYQRLLDTNRHARYACCELSPLIAPGTNTSNVLPLPSADFGRSIFSNMGSILSGISGKSNISHSECLGSSCIDFCSWAHIVLISIFVVCELVLMNVCMSSSGVYNAHTI